MKFIGLPERETNEKPATEKQIRYLLDLVPWLKERDLRKLGIKQAGYLIEQALKERGDDDNDDDEDDDEEEYFEQPKARKSSQPKRAGRKKSMGCWFYLFMFALIVFLLGFITMTFAHW